MPHPLEKVARHRKTAPVKIEQAIRDLGIALKKNADLPKNIAGHIKRIDGENYEIASTSSDHYFRQRFTMAHELGHYILHRSLIGSGVDDDTKYRSTETGEFYNENIDQFHERQANSFAANFLIPERLIRDDALEVRSLRELSKKYQVSPSAMRWRLKNLSLWEEELDDVANA